MKMFHYDYEGGFLCDDIGGTKVCVKKHDILYSRLDILWHYHDSKISLEV